MYVLWSWFHKFIDQLLPLAVPDGLMIIPEKVEQGNVEQVNLLYLLIKLHDYNPYNQKIPYIAVLFFFMDGFQYSL